MGSGDFKNINMKYLAIRWFTLSHFDKSKLNTFHSLETALKNAGINCWHPQTKNYLKQEFKKLLVAKYHKKEMFIKFENNLQKFFNANNLEPILFLENIDFIHKCDEIIYRKAHAIKTLPL